MNFFQWLRLRGRPLYEYGICECKKARRNSLTGEVQFVLWELERWGMQGGAPFDDGHRARRWLSDLVFVRPGCWRDEWPSNAPRWSCSPLYYLQMSIKPTGQLQLF